MAHADRFPEEHGNAQGPLSPGGPHGLPRKGEGGIPRTRAEALDALSALLDWPGEVEEEAVKRSVFWRSGDGKAVLWIPGLRLKATFYWGYTKPVVSVEVA